MAKGRSKASYKAAAKKAAATRKRNAKKAGAKAAPKKATKSAKRMGKKVASPTFASKKFTCHGKRVKVKGKKAGSPRVFCRRESK